MKNLRFPAYLRCGLLAVAGSMLFAASSYGNTWSSIDCPDPSVPKGKTSKLVTNINGVSIVDYKDGVTRLLAVIEYFKEADSQLALLTVAADGKAGCTSLKSIPGKLEAITSIPGYTTSFLAISETGYIVPIKYDACSGSVILGNKFRVPPKSLGNFEGLAVQKIETEWVIAWADRGSDGKPANLFWSKFDPETNVISETEMDVKPVRVGHPIISERRDIADIKIAPNGRVFIVSTSDPGDYASLRPGKGNFDSAFYAAGAFRIGTGNKIEFDPPAKYTALLKYFDQKIEGFEFLPNGGIAFATDNEASGATFYVHR